MSLCIVWVSVVSVVSAVVVLGVSVFGVTLGVSCTGACPNMATCFFTLGSLVTFGLGLGVGRTCTVAVTGLGVGLGISVCQGAIGVGDPGVLAVVHTVSGVGT